MTFLLKLVGLPLIALLTLMEWLGIFALGISQFIAGGGVALVGTTLVLLLSSLF